MSGERAITVIIPDSMWAELVAAVSRAGLAASDGGQEQSLAERVKTARIRRGLSREKLAERASVNIKTIERLEDEVCSPIEGTLRRIALALSLDAVSLVEARGKGRVGWSHGRRADA